MTKESKAVLHEIIVGLVHSHSGGVKLTELITDTISVLYERQLDEIACDDNLLNDFTAIIKGSPVLKFIEYTSHEHNREKMFVYTP